MDNIQFEKEICAYLSLPSIPIKEWDGKSAFDKGVAVVKIVNDAKAYAIARYNPQTDKEPTIVKTFSCEVFFGIEKVLVVPDYMNTDISDADLDDASKEKAKEIINEAEQIENEGVNNDVELPENPYLFDNITNDEEAIAFITAYNQKNGIKGQVPKKHESILNRLLVIYMEQNRASGANEL